MTVDYIERIIQDADYHAIMERVSFTIATQTQIADQWVWNEKDVATWNAEEAAIDAHPDGLHMRQTEKETEKSGAESHLTSVLKNLHESTVAAVSVARVRWRRVPERLLVLAGLRAGGTTAVEILQEAEECELAWEAIEPGMEPVTGLTLALFQTQIAAARAAVREVRRTAVHLRLSNGQLGVALHAINDAAVAWYAEATAVFRNDANVRHLLDGIPTTYVPRYYKAQKERRAAARAGK